MSTCPPTSAVEVRVGAARPGGEWAGVLGVVVCALLWSLNGPFIKTLVADAPGRPGLAAETVAFYRSLLGGLFFLPLALRRAGTLRRVGWRWPAASVAMFTLMSACFVIATARTAASSAIVLQYTSPIWVFLLSPLFLGEKPSRTDGAVLAGAMTGVLVILLASGRSELPALLIALGAGLGYGALTVALRGLREVDGAVVVAMNMLGSSLLLAPWVASSVFAVTAGQLALLGVMSLVQYALPYALFSWSLRRIAAHKAALISLLETVFNPLLTYLVVGERIPRATLVGGPIILLSVAGGLFASGRARRRRAAAAGPAAS